MTHGIKKISRLESFGVFRDFSWNDLDEFTKTTIIYGWNYSGKTTLSRLFHVLSQENREEVFPNSKFVIHYMHKTRSHVATEKPGRFPFTVKVFNSEYISKIFAWDSQADGIAPIYFHLGQDARITGFAIRAYKRQEENIICDLDRLSPIIEKFKPFERPPIGFTNLASKIRRYLKIYKPADFNRNDAFQAVNLVKQNPKNYELPNFLKALSDYSTAKKPGLINHIECGKEKLHELIVEVRHILLDTPPTLNELMGLRRNHSLQRWVMSGMEFNTENMPCKFCGNRVSEDRMAKLNSFFSEKFKIIHSLIKKADEKIEEEISRVKFDIPGKSFFANHLHPYFDFALLQYIDSKKQYISQLKRLKVELQRKRHNIFEVIQPRHIKVVSLYDEVKALNQIIGRHNEWVQNYDKKIKRDKIDLINHLVYQFLMDEDYIEKEKNAKNAKANTDALKRKLDDVIRKRKGLEGTLKAANAGKDELNRYLNLILKRDDIKIQVHEEKFTLMRDGKQAANLSEGEKSAIAFSYFLTDLQSVKDEFGFQNTIIFIDDPISSLDSNHIFQVFYLISELRRQNPLQIFVSTHNFDFLSLFQRFARKNSFGFYFVERDKLGSSTLKKLPKAFIEYNTEYVALFHILNQYMKSGNRKNYGGFATLPNVLRRFLELYTLAKYPSSESVSERVKEVFKNGKVESDFALTNWFSHNNNLEALDKHDDKIFCIDGAIESVFDHIKEKDDLHWKGLIKGTSDVGGENEDNL